MLRAAGAADGGVTHVAITVQAANDTLGMGTNYTYSLAYVKGSGGGSGSGAGSVLSVAAASPFGVAYAMETLLQLATPSVQNECGGGFRVVDTPTFDHRGLLLDTGRRFFPVSLVKTTIEAMAIFKLNVLHFHLSEARFRVESKLFPQLTACPAAPHVPATSCQFYTQADVKAIVDFAYLRGVRVVAEFDMPGHSTAICDALKPIGLVCCSGKWGMGQIGDDADGNSTRIVGALLEEMAQLFPDSVMHLGGDECSYGATGKFTL